MRPSGSTTARIPATSHAAMVSKNRCTAATTAVSSPAPARCAGRESVVRVVGGERRRPQLHSAAVRAAAGLEHEGVGHRRRHERYREVGDRLRIALDVEPEFLLLFSLPQDHRELLGRRHVDAEVVVPRGELQAAGDDLEAERRPAHAAPDLRVEEVHEARVRAGPLEHRRVEVEPAILEGESADPLDLDSLRQLLRRGARVVRERRGGTKRRPDADQAGHDDRREASHQSLPHRTHSHSPCGSSRERQFTITWKPTLERATIGTLRRNRFPSGVTSSKMGVSRSGRSEAGTACAACRGGRRAASRSRPP